MTGRLVATVLLVAATGLGCRQDMHDQPKYTALESSEFFADGRASRPPVEGTVARGQLFDDPHMMTGKIDGEFADSFPFEVTADVMRRGQERYDIFCSPCHARTGSGLGMVVRRGFPQPPSMHEQRLIDVREGYLFDVVKRGFGRMLGYAAQIPVEDRWAIVAYTRALQFSRNAPVDALPASVSSNLPVEEVRP